MFRAAITAVLGALAACAAALEPEASGDGQPSVAGEYVLQDIGGQRLPARFGSYTVISAGRLRLLPEGTFVEEVTFGTQHNARVSVLTGFWTDLGGRVEFHNAYTRPAWYDTGSAVPFALTKRYARGEWRERPFSYRK